MERDVSPHTPRVLGLTGPIACGKTTVGDILLQLGAIDRIDADRVVHELQAAGAPLARAIAERFGPEMLLADGSVDRAKLGAAVFADPAALRDLEALTHPAVRREVRERIASHAGKRGVVVVDAVKLLQSELLPLCDGVWVVRCEERIEISRLTRIRGLDEAAARARLRAQPSFDHPAVTAVIDNSGTLDGLREWVTDAWEAQLEGWKHDA